MQEYIDICDYAVGLSRMFAGHVFPSESMCTLSRASDFFQDWWAELTNGAKKRGSFSEMMGPSISN